MMDQKRRMVQLSHWGGLVIHVVVYLLIEKAFIPFLTASCAGITVGFMQVQ